MNEDNEDNDYNRDHKDNEDNDDNDDNYRLATGLQMQCGPLYSAFLNILNLNDPHLSLMFQERPHFPKMCISQDLKVNSVTMRFLRNFCGQ